MASTSNRRSDSVSTASAKRLRKRELDRKAQRVARSKTKDRIAYLENVVEATRRDDSTEVVASLINQLKVLGEERDSLKRLLLSIQGSIRDQLSTGANSTTEEMGHFPSTGDKVPHGETPVTLESGRGVEVAAVSSSTAPQGTANLLHPSFSSDPGNLALASDMDLSSNGNWFDSLCVESWTGDLLHADPARPPSLSSVSTCSCLSSRSTVLPDGTPVHSNLWRAANEILSNQISPSDAKSSMREDLMDDAIIRGLIEGWEDVEARYKSTSRWKTLRRLDMLHVHSWGQIERLAGLWIIQLLMRYKNDPTPQNLSSLPAWYRETAWQGSSYSDAIDYFPWPGLRQRFIRTQHQYCHDVFWQHFKENLRITWPFRFRDCYGYRAYEGRYYLSPAFKNTIYDIDSWTMAASFFANFPEFGADIREYVGGGQAASNLCDVSLATAALEDHASVTEENSALSLEDAICFGFGDPLSLMLSPDGPRGELI